MNEKTELSSFRKTMEVIVMPFPGQGHLNTMLQFAKRLAWKGASYSIRITLATTLSTTKKMTKSTSRAIDLLPIYDDTNDDPELDFFVRIKKFEAEASVELNSAFSRGNPSLFVYDANLSWALDIAKQHGVMTAAFFTQSCAYVACLYNMLQEENNVIIDNPPPLFLKVPSQEELTQGLKTQPLKNHSDDCGKKPLHPIIKMVISHLTNIHLADWVLFNSFDHLEDQLVKWMTTLWPSKVRTIGPTLPSIYLDKRIENDVDYGFNLYKPNNEACMNWLNEQQVASVVYVSFGSVASFSIEQMAELAMALKQIPSKFLWVVREMDQKNLPEDFISETSNKGLVLSWCPQLDVLAHQAVGCFITHCGWNSTIEAVSFGVPILAMPLFLDQVIHAQFLDQVWEVGVRAKANENKLVTCDEIKHCFDEIMHGQKAMKIKENVEKAKALAIEAVGAKGSSDEHIDEIINRIALCQSELKCMQIKACDGPNENLKLCVS